jgi:hypothetical protein
LALDERDREALRRRLIETKGDQVAGFVSALDQALLRRVSAVIVTVLHGNQQQIATISAAIDFLQRYSETAMSTAPPSKWEIDVRFTNGDTIHAVFQQKVDAIRFLESFR